MIVDFEKSDFSYYLKIPVLELGKEIKITLKKPSFHYNDPEYAVMKTLCEYNDERLQFDVYVPVKGKCLLEIVEKGLYLTIRHYGKYDYTSFLLDDLLPMLPSTCGFFYWYTFQKLRGWIRDHAEFSFNIEGKAADGSVVTAKYSSNGWGREAEIYCGGYSLGNIRMGRRNEGEGWAREDDVGWAREDDEESSRALYRGGSAEDYAGELARIESFCLSRQWFTKEMEKALQGRTWPWGQEKTMADQKVIAVYYHDYYPEKPNGTISSKAVRFQYYIVKGKRCKEGGWRFFGLIYKRTWKWGDIFVGECGEELHLPFLPTDAMRMPGIFGQRLEDVLKENGEPGWETMVYNPVTADIWKEKNSMNPEWRREVKERLSYLIGQGLEDRALQWFRQGSSSLCLQNADKIFGIFRCENILDCLQAMEYCEKKYGVCVYYVMAMSMFSHVSLAMLYVGSNPEEWEYERQELKKQIPTVITCILDDEDGQKDIEIGSTHVKVVDGGLIRVS